MGERKTSHHDPASINSRDSPMIAARCRHRRPPTTKHRTPQPRALARSRPRPHLLPPMRPEPYPGTPAPAPGPRRRALRSQPHPQPPSRQLGQRPVAHQIPLPPERFAIRPQDHGQITIAARSPHAAVTISCHPDSSITCTVQTKEPVTTAAPSIPPSAPCPTASCAKPSPNCDVIRNHGRTGNAGRARTHRRTMVSRLPSQTLNAGKRQPSQQERYPYDPAGKPQETRSPAPPHKRRLPYDQ